VKSLALAGAVCDAAAAFLLVRALLGRPRQGDGAPLVLLGTLTAFIALFGLSHLLWLLLFAPAAGGVLVCDGALLTPGLVLWWRDRRRADDRRPASSPESRTLARASMSAGERWPRSRWIVFLATGAIVAVSTATLLLTLRALPYGEWDAYAIWNLRARMLARAAGSWQRVFDPMLTHSGYPLLQPLVIARAWVATGSESTVVPRALALVATLLMPGWLLFTLRAIRGNVTACLAVVAVIAVPGAALPRMFAQAAGQHAEPLLGCFLLAAACLVALVTSDHAPVRALLLAGFFAGCAAWTKNEGMLWSLALLAAVLVPGAMQLEVRSGLRSAAVFLLGLGIPLALLWYVKRSFVQEPDEFLSRPVPMLLRYLSQIDRHRLVLSTVGWFVRWTGTWALLLILLGMLAGCGLARRRELRRAAVALAVAVALAGAGYYVIYVISPYDLEWHLQSSLDRVFMQLWPTLVLALFVIMRSPEEMWAGAASATDRA